MARPCTNTEPCLGWEPGKGGHSQVCQRLVAQGARPRSGPTRPPRPAKLNPPTLDVEKGEGKIGCGCGEVLELKSRNDVIVRDGKLHRYGLPCVPAPERAGREGDQELPTQGIGDVSQQLVEWCMALGHVELAALAKERRATGMRRYGNPLQLFNGRDVCRDRVEELLDGAAYTLQAHGEYRALVEALLALARCVRTGISGPASDAALALAAKLEKTA